MPPAAKSRIILRSRLEHDVDRVLRQFESNGSQRFKSTPDAYDAIQRSNSSLKRQKKRPLEDAIDRVLLFHKQEDGDSSDSEAALEEAEAATVQSDSRFSLNRQLTKLWHHDTPVTSTANSEAQSPAKKRRIAEDTEDASATEPQPNGKISTDAIVSTQEKRALKKSHKPVRFTVEHVDYEEPLYGLGTLPAQLFDLTRVALRLPEHYQDGSDRHTGFIISGPVGMGKRSLVRNMAAKLRVSLVTLDMCLLDAERMEKSMTDAFDAAMAQAPSIILIGEMELCMARPNSPLHSDVHAKAVALFIEQMRRLRRSRTEPCKCLVIGTTSSIADVNPRVMRFGLFEKTLRAKIPDYDGRREVLQRLTSKTTLGEDVDLDELARVTHGSVPAELALIIKEAKQKALKDVGDGDDGDIRSSESQAAMLEGDEEVLHAKRYPARATVPVSLEVMKSIMEEFVPTLRKEGFTVIPNVTWDQVGGLEAAREELCMSIVGPIKQPALYAEFGLKPTAGVLLWGPPGCGKTLIAQAVANDAKASFILINGPELLNKYVGESERAVRELFQRARASQPCILFFDEIDSVVPPRANSTTESGARVVNALLTELDGAQDRTGVYVIGTTNRPEMIDEAVLRPGRLGTQIFIDLPTPDERVEILRAIFRTCHKKPCAGVLDGLADVALDERCANFSGADLSGLHAKAAQAALRRFMQDQRSSKEITEADWEVALHNTRASVSDPESYRSRNQALRGR
ncbi:hypothetical protein E4U41_006030 [Claviceps citrina]|nr:hypothetical protein E4U41_006030 [Claviceps citrina]